MKDFSWYCKTNAKGDEIRLAVCCTRYTHDNDETYAYKIFGNNAEGVPICYYVIEAPPAVVCFERVVNSKMTGNVMSLEDGFLRQLGDGEELLACGDTLIPAVDATSDLLVKADNRWVKNNNMDTARPQDPTLADKLFEYGLLLVSEDTPASSSPISVVNTYRQKNARTKSSH